METNEARAQLERELVGTLDPAQAGDRVVSSLLRLFGVRRSVLFELDRASRRFACIATAGHADPEKWIGWTVPEGVDVTGLAVAEGRSVWSADLLADPRFTLPEWVVERLKEEGCTWGIGIPLIAREEVLGALGLYDAPSRVFTAENLWLLFAFAEQAALVLENARLYQETEQRLRQTETLLALGRTVGSTLELTEVLRRTTREMVRILGADMGGGWLLNPREDLFLPVVGYHIPKDLLEVYSWTAGAAADKLVEETRRSEGPIWSSDSQADPRFNHPLARLLPHKSIFIQPVRLKGDMIGVFAIAWVLERHSFTPDELRLAGGIAQQAAIAIENARVMESLRRALEDLRVAQDQLVQTRTLRAVGELATGIAHHLNNLLAVMLMRIQLLRGKSREPENHRSLEIVEKTTLQAAEVVRRVLAFGRAQPVSETAPVDLDELAQDALELTRPLWQGQGAPRGLRIQAVLKPGRVPPVPGDQPALREALLNVLLNAIEAVAEGGRITIKTWASDRRAHCSVTDTGVGMSEEVRGRALEPFFTTKGPSRTGLGLSLAYGIIQRHGGELAIECAEGKGTTVTISLPLPA
jgi:signal transduction histidine kinase